MPRCTTLQAPGVHHVLEHYQVVWWWVVILAHTECAIVPQPREVLVGRKGGGLWDNLEGPIQKGLSDST